MSVRDRIAIGWAWLIRPARDTTGKDEWQKSRLIAAMSLLFAASIPVSLGLLYPVRPDVLSTFDTTVLMIGALLLFIIYLINRLLSYSVALVMTMIVILFVPLITPFVPGGTGQMLPLQIIPVLSYAFLSSPQSSLFVILVTLGFSAAMIAVMPPGNSRDVFIDSWTLTLILDLAVLAFMLYQREIENERRAELEQANRRLVRSESDLEKRVHLRTEQLRAINLLLAEEVAMRKHSEEELVLAHERLQGLDQMKKDFIDSVSHELRTPVTTLKVYHHLLKEKPGQADMYVPRLQAETARLEQVVAGILSISQLTAELEEATYTTLIDFGAMVQEKMEQWSMRMEAQGIVCTATGLMGLPVRVMGNRVLLDHLLSILMDNIVKYTPPGGEVNAEVVSCSPDEKALCIALTNTTTHVEEGTLDRLFERFTRGEAALVNKVPGAGLGLFMAREIARRHHSTLHLKAIELNVNPAIRIVMTFPVVAAPESALP